MEKVSGKLAIIHRRFRLLYMLVSLLIPVSFVCAADIIVLQSASDELYNNLSAEIRSNILTGCEDSCKKNLTIRQLNIENFENFSVNSDEDSLIITLGVKAYQATLRPGLSEKIHYIHALMPIKNNLELSDHRNYFFIEINPKEIISLTQKLLQPEKPLLIFYSEESAWRVNDYANAASEFGIKLQAVKTSFTNIGRDLSQTDNKYAVLIMLPDKELYNRQTIRQILLKGFTLNLPFIGYSSALTRLGTMLSFVAPLEQHADNIAEFAYKLINKQKINKRLFYPGNVSVKLNKNISRAMNLDINVNAIDNDIEVLE